MFTSRSFDRKFGRHHPWRGRGYTPLWPWQACFYALLGLISTAILVAAVLILSTCWKVSSVTVEGHAQYDAEILIEASEIRAGDSMMSFGGKSLEQQLRADYPLLRSVKVRRRLNGQVILKVIEETDLYYTCHHSNYYLISAQDLIVLGVSSHGTEYENYGAMYIGFPEEARIRLGEKITFAYLPYEPVSAPEELATFEIVTGEAEQEYAYVWSFVKAVRDTSALEGRVTGMELGDRYDLYLVFDGHVKIRFGSMKELDRKLTQAVEILSREIDGSRMPAVLDVSNIEKSTYREDSELILPDWAAQ